MRESLLTNTRAHRLNSSLLYDLSQKAETMVENKKRPAGIRKHRLLSEYERLIFQSLTYQKEPRRYEIQRIPVLFVMTSNCPEEYYPALGYRKMLKTYQKALNEAVGNTKVLIAGDTLQVKDYSRFNWTMFDAASKRERHEKVFPEEQKKAFRLGAQMVTKPW